MWRVGRAIDCQQIAVNLSVLISGRTIIWKLSPMHLSVNTVKSESLGTGCLLSARHLRRIALHRPLPSPYPSQLTVLWFCFLISVLLMTGNMRQWLEAIQVLQQLSSSRVTTRAATRRCVMSPSIVYRMRRYQEMGCQHVDSWTGP